jgi:o-succinylbenzoate---CoA ligase
MNQLVALELPATAAFADVLQQVWSEGDAFAPLDPRLPASERIRVLEAIRPSVIIDASGARIPLNGGRPVESGDALVISTSGTTGLPKGVVHTHTSLLASARATSAALGIDPTTDHWLACLPLAHIGGLSVVLRALLTGTRLTIHNGFAADAVTRAAVNDGVTRVSLVTKALQQIDPQRFTTVLLGGAAPPADRPANCIATYGMTETGSGIVYEARTLDGVELRVDERDEIWVRGPMLLRAYRIGSHDIDPKSTDGWFATGDLGGWHDDGRLFVSGRQGEVIATGGEKVWPARLEPVLQQCPGVAEVAVTGRVDAQWGHIVVAHIVPVDESHPPSLDAIREFVKTTLPVWYAPKDLLIHAELPKTALGKIKRAELRD